MKAATVRTLGEPLTVADVPVPPIESHQVLVKIETCGLATAYSSSLPSPPTTTSRCRCSKTVLGGITIRGSIVGTRQDLDEVFRLHAAGKTRVIRESLSLDDVNEAFEEVLSGATTARLVFDMR